MENEMIVYEASQGLTIMRPPEEVLAEAQRAAKALAEVVGRKRKPVMFNGEQYLEFEDWQTVGRFYGVTAKVVSTEFLDLGGVQGFIAKAAALRTDGMEVSAAEAMCMNDEPNWKNKPLFQLRSMAQTRACSKALRNVLAWVVVLAGYRPTPAEEMQGVYKADAKAEIQAPQKKSPPPSGTSIDTTISACSEKSGTTGDRAWTLYAFKDKDETLYKTFDASCAAIASEAKENGSPVRIHYALDAKGNKNVSAIEILEAA